MTRTHIQRDVGSDHHSAQTEHGGGQPNPIHPLQVVEHGAVVDILCVVSVWNTLLESESEYRKSNREVEDG
jgi:hypothetical protein